MDGDRIQREDLEKLGAALKEEAADLPAVLKQAHPHDIVEVWEELSPARRMEVVKVLPAEMAADVLSDLPLGKQVEVLEELPDETVGPLLNAFDPDDLVDVLQHVEEQTPEKVEAFKSSLTPGMRAAAESLSRYHEEEAGGIMTPEFVSVRSSMTVGEVIQFLRRATPEAETVYTIFVEDEAGRLAGVISMRDLIIAPENRRVAEIMKTDVVRVTTRADQEDVARLMADYDLTALPVVDDTKRLVGIVTVDDIIDVMESEATEDIHRLGAAPVDIDYPRSGPFFMFRKRLPWLGFLVVSMTLTFNVIAFYEDLLAEVVILAAFIPLLIDTGGNVGSQAATLVVRSLATQDLGLRDYWRVLVKEIGTGLMLGVGLAVLVFLFVLVLRGEQVIALAISITMVLIVMVANLLGAGLPFLFRKIGVDPALTSSPIITTVMDVVGLLIYFQVVMQVLGW